MKVRLVLPVATTLLLALTVAPAAASTDPAPKPSEKSIAELMEEFQPNPYEEPGRLLPGSARKATPPADTCQDPALTSKATQAKPYTICMKPTESGEGATTADLPRPPEVPAWCADYLEDWPNGRLQACQQRKGELILRDRRGREVGSVTIHHWNLITANPAKNEIEFDQWIGATDVDGHGYAVLVEAEAGCTGPCAPYTNPWPRADVVAGQYRRVFHTIAANLSGTAIEIRNGIFPNAKVTYSHPLAANTSDISAEPTQPIRCDYKAAGGSIADYGCVFPTFWGTHLVPRWIVPFYAGHILDAQAAGLPGAPPTPGNNNPLHRTTDQSIIDLNESLACRAAPNPRPTGYECDEYPFKSTREGASSGRWSWRLIPEAENRAGGDNLMAFYRSYRLLDRDSFYVKVVDSNPAPDAGR